MTCRGNVHILQQRSQTTLTVLVLWMKYKTGILVSRHEGVDVTPLDILKFIVIWWKLCISQLESGTADSVDSVYFCYWLQTFIL